MLFTATATQFARQKMPPAVSDGFPTVPCRAALVVFRLKLLRTLGTVVANLAILFERIPAKVDIASH